MGIHDPDALWHYAGYTYCPWCGKEGQNEETIINHLRTTHYRLGPVCDWCFGCPTVMSDSLCGHGHQNCQQYCVTSGSGLSNWLACQTRSFHEGAKAVLSNQTPFPPRRPEDLTKKALPASLPNPSFILQPCQQTAIFILTLTSIPKGDATDYT